MAAQFHKYHDEVRRLVFDYTPLTTLYGITMQSPATVATISPPDSGLSIGTPGIGTSTVSVLLSNGTAGSTYVVGCICATSDGESARINATIIIRADNEVP